jgi:hypothetical protein
MDYANTISGQVPQYPGQAQPDQIAAAWAIYGNRFKPVPETRPELPAGFYRTVETNTGLYAEKFAIDIDGLMELPDPTCDMLVAEFITFWERAHKFAKMGLIAKRGILLHGPPGSGKTSALQRMAAHAIQKLNGIVWFVTNPHVDSIMLKELRQIEPSRPLIVIYEDLDGILERCHQSMVLAMLDGELQVKNAVNIATTNYIERLGSRIVDRPGRFDRVQRVGMPNIEARTAYILGRIPALPDQTVAAWVEASEGWSIAHLRELVVAVEVLGEDPEAVIERLVEMGNLPVGEWEDEGRVVGIGRELQRVPKRGFR